MNTYGSISKTTIDSAILNLSFIHNYKVICTENEQDTLNQILSLCKKIQNNELIKSDINTNVKLIKKSDYLKDNVFINMLSVIPGVSINIAKKISERYISMYNLIREYNNLDEEVLKEKMLSNLQLTLKRKLGDVLSKKIYNSINTKTDLRENSTCLIDD